MNPVFSSKTLSRGAKVAIGIALSCLVVLVGTLLYIASHEHAATACTQDAKICPDGSTVGRVGPYCQFADCPSTSTVGGAPGSVACAEDMRACPDGSLVPRVPPSCDFAPCNSQTGFGTLEGHVTIGPICPVERPGQPCPVPPEMYAARKVLIYNADRTVLIQTVSLDTSGNYRIRLAVGRYTVDVSRAGGIGGVRGVPTIAPIEPNGTATVDIMIDTGIR